MAHRSFAFDALAIAAAATLTHGTAAWAQPASGMATVIVTGRSVAPVGIGGFGDMPLARSPLQATSIGREALADAGVASLAALTRLDPGLGDAYNAEGYWSQLSARGFVIDNRANYRRDGLPINAETHLSLANKERIEILKGTSGIQAGTSAPGGLVNLVVKRPQAGLRQGTLEWQSDGSVTAQADLSDRFGPDGRLGLRVNAQAARLDPPVRQADGRSRLLALAADAVLDADRRIEVEIERSHRSQPSVPGFSLLGASVPEARAIDPRTNLNNQPWSQPVVLDGTTASLRWVQRLGRDWQFTAHAGRQRLRSDDRVAFPFGCYDATTDVYYADRFCPDGSFDLYDFRSGDERRGVDAVDLQLHGQLQTAALRHQLTLGVQRSAAKDRFARQAFNYVGVGRLDASGVTPADPALTTDVALRDERSTELYLRDIVTLNRDWQLWVGLRHSRLDRRSVLTDGSGATAYVQSFTTPWLALAWSIDAQTLAYASAGQGVESEVVPNRTRYDNAGQPLPALKSRQLELGLKHEQPGHAGSLVAFDIERPQARDLCGDEEPLRCTRAIDGAVRHRGVEAVISLRKGAWSGQLGAMWLHARTEGGSDATSRGLRPTNVPATTQRAQVAVDIAALPGLTLQGAFMREGARTALPDNSIAIPAWTRIDIGARWRNRWAGTAVLWRIDLANALDQRAWRESPYQFGHAWLFPLAPRSWRVSMQVDM